MSSQLATELPDVSDVPENIACPKESFGIMNVQDTLESSGDESEYELLHRKDAEEKSSSSVTSWNWRNILAIVFLWIAYFICNMAYSIISPFFPEEARMYGTSPVAIGVIISSSPLSVAVLSPLFGYLLPRIGVWPLVFVGLLLVGSSFTSLGFINYIPYTHGWIFIMSCVFLRVTEGVGTAMFLTATFSTLPNLFPKSVATVMGMFEVSAGISYSLGPLLGGILYQYGGFRLPFLSVGGSVLLFIIPCALLVRKMSIGSKRESLSLKIIFKFSTDLTFIALGLVLVLIYNSVGFYAPSLQLFLTDEFNLNPVQVGSVFFAMSITYGLLSFFIGPLSDRLGGHRSFILFGVFLVSLIHFAIGLQFILDFVNLWLVRIAFIFAAVGNAASSIPLYPEMIKITKRYKIEDDKEIAVAAIVSGWISCCINLGQFMWPLLGGLMANFYSLPMNALFVSELVLAEGLLLMGITVIDKYTWNQ